MLKIMVVDDEKLALEDSASTIKGALQNVEVICANGPKEALIIAKEETIDVAFLDIEMPFMTGLELAEVLQEIYPKMNIIFLTAFMSYAMDAYKVCASDYCLKPLKESEVIAAMERLRNPTPETKKIDQKEDKLIRVKCFGNFAIFDHSGKPIMFKRKKTEELFAYLIANYKEQLNVQKICEDIWGEYDSSSRNYFWKITSELRSELRKIGCDDVLMQKRNRYTIDPTKISCDYFDYMDGKLKVKNPTIFMKQYESWSYKTVQIIKKYINS